MPVDPVQIEKFTFQCASVRVAKELRALHPKLKDILLDAARIALDKNQYPLLVTSVYRTPAEDAKLHATGVHCCRPHRALDIDTFTMGEERATAIENELRRRWQYDPSRPGLPVCYGGPINELHGTGPHLHLQVSAFTVLMPGVLK